VLSGFDEGEEYERRAMRCYGRCMAEGLDHLTREDEWQTEEEPTNSWTGSWEDFFQAGRSPDQRSEEERFHSLLQREVWLSLLRGAFRS
jgi:hypothetical protein